MNLKNMTKDQLIKYIIQNGYASDIKENNNNAQEQAK